MSEPLDLPCAVAVKAKISQDIWNTFPHEKYAEEGLRQAIASGEVRGPREDWEIFPIYRAPSPVGTAPLREALARHLWKKSSVLVDMTDWDDPDEECRETAREAWRRDADEVLALLPRSAPTLKGAPADDL